MRNKYLFAQIIFMIISFSAIGQNADIIPRSKTYLKSQNDAKILPTDLQKSYDVKWCFLNLNAENNTTMLSGDVTIKAEVVSSDLDTFSFHLHRDYIIDSVKVDGNIMSVVTRDDERLIGDIELVQEDIFDVQIFYHGEMEQTSDFFTGINSAMDRNFNFNVTWTLSEPNNAYHWFPVKQDLTDKIDSVWVFVTTSNNNKVASNGKLTNIVSLPGEKVRYEWKSNYPIAYYLISIAVANYLDYSIYAEIPGVNEPVLIQNYVYNSETVLNYFKDVIDETADMMVFFSDIYGTYPFYKEKYGHSMAYFGGGMEHQTMTTLVFYEEGLMVHELAHQWFGDNVTCGSWEYIWVNEGFASYSEFLWYEHKYGRDLTMQQFYKPLINDVLSKARQGSVYVPLQYIDSDERIFSETLSYNKGSILVHMLRFELNDDELFFDILKTYQQRFANSTATADNFKNVVNELSGKDFSVFFDQWFYGEGYPRFNIKWGQTKDNRIIISSKQTTTSTVTPLFKTPFELNIKYENGDEEIIRLNQEEQIQNFTHNLEPEFEVASISFDPNSWLLAGSTVEKDSDLSDKIITSGKLNVNPNPANDFINLSFDSSFDGEKNIQIYNVLGNTIINMNSYEDCFKIDISDYVPGIYYIVVKSGKNTGVKKFIKE